MDSARLLCAPGIRYAQLYEYYNNNHRGREVGRLFLSLCEEEVNRKTTTTTITTTTTTTSVLLLLTQKPSCNLIFVFPHSSIKWMQQRALFGYRTNKANETHTHTDTSWGFNKNRRVGRWTWRRRRWISNRCVCFLPLIAMAVAWVWLLPRVARTVHSSSSAQLDWKGYTRHLLLDCRLPSCIYQK